jgi:hypothetical protein
VVSFCYNHYELIGQKERQVRKMTSNQQILSDLRLIMEASHEIELLSNYKGVPFICKARIESIDGNVVQLRAHDPASVCLENSEQTRMLGSEYFEPALARVISFDILSGVILLSDFSYVGTKLGERMIVRVEPREPIEVYLELGDQRIDAQLVDVSLNGLGVMVSTEDYAPSLKPGTIVEAAIGLPGGTVSLPGTILSVSKAPNSYRLSVRFTEPGANKYAIFRYIVDRRAEIENELRAEYDAAIHEKKTMS